MDDGCPMTPDTPDGEPRIRIVIAEDEAIIRLDLKETLEAEGYEVVGDCSRGDVAIELVRTLRPDVVILDIKMPGLDGIAFLDEQFPQHAPFRWLHDLDVALRDKPAFRHGNDIKLSEHSPHEQHAEQRADGLEHRAA